MKKTASDIFMALVYMMLIISVSVILTLNFRPLYYWDMDYLKISENTGMSREEIRKNYDELIDYNMNPLKEELDFPTLAMSEPGRIHFVEVKRIFQAFIYIGIGTLILAAVGTMWKRKRMEYGFFKLASILTIAIPLVLGILGGINWDKAFVTFHHIFFNNDYWIFDPAIDPVITILPDTYFLHCAAMILGLMIAGSIVCMILYHKLRRKRPV